MPKRRLRLAREVLTSLQPADLEAVYGAAPISHPNPVCLVTGTTSARWSHCPSCGIGCTMDCPTNDCPTNGCR